jgi:hypothetical protein
VTLPEEVCALPDTPNVAVEWLVPLLRIREVLARNSILGLALVTGFFSRPR